MKPPPPPKPPPTRICIEGCGSGFCPSCGSTMLRKYWLFGPRKCVSPECGLVL